MENFLLCWPPVTIDCPVGGVDMPVLGKSAPTAIAGPLSYSGGTTYFTITQPQAIIQRSSGARTCLALCPKIPIY